MAFAAKFWPPRLLGFGSKAEDVAAFSPTTAIAARIVSRSQPGDAGSLEAAKEAQAPASDMVAANDADAARLAERFVPLRASTVITDTRGKSMRARIINLSATGVAVEADFRVMPADSVTMVGSKAVVLGRAIRGGQVFLFDKPLDPARCTPQIVL